jgi:hypothetical protein
VTSKPRADFLTAEPEWVLYDWINDRIGLAFSTDFRAFGRVVDGKIVGVVAYTGHTGKACQMHMAGDHPRWITPTFLRTAFHMPFVEWGYEVVFGMVPSGNEVALKMDLKLGFKLLHTVPNAHPDGALHLLMMNKADCRWLRQE